jgi:pimeloyl-ACP methyl ester carboxylesterase
MDLRGYGASDKPPRGYDTPTLAADVAGVVRSLGHTQAVIIGHDWGAWIAWSMPGLQPRATRAIAPLAMGHPLTLRRPGWEQLRAVGRLAQFQLPITPERFLGDRDGVARVLRSWTADGAVEPEALRRYERAMQLPFVAHTCVEYYRWAVRSLTRRDGRRFAEAVRAPITIPVLQIQGGRDPWILPETSAASRRWITGPARYEVIGSAGHFLPEEAPDRVTTLLLDWLSALPPLGDHAPIW